MYYQMNRLRAQTKHVKPTRTDQSQAKDTDINVIVGKFLTNGVVPGNNAKPMSGDFTGLPSDLRGMIETSREMEKKRRQLPPALREMPIDELLALTPDKLTSILTPPAPTPSEEKK